MTSSIDRIMVGYKSLQAGQEALYKDLHQPAVAVRVFERDERAVALVAGRRASDPCRRTGVMEHASGVVEHAADLGAAGGQVGPGRVDVVCDQVQALHRARRGRGHASAEDDRACRPGRGQLHHAVVGPADVIGVEPPAQRLVEVLGFVHVGDRYHHDLESVVHDLSLPHLVPVLLVSAGLIQAAGAVVIFTVAPRGI